ncbi:DUF3515 family protein [Dactylosporangium sp. NPDC049525]|uniref:DUF3515 family protein n=1 Tax=Dactylosporangium sp. NPDC049525 TaxID=3154730 RepID=UPI003437281B
MLAAVVAVPVAIITGVAVWMISRPQPMGENRPVPTAPLPVSATPGSQRAAVCQALVGSLPMNLLEATRRPVTAPNDRFAAAFGEPPIIVRCDTAKRSVAKEDMVYLVSGTCWATHPTGSSTTWTTVDRNTAVGVSVPNYYTSQGQYVEALAGAVRDTLTKSEEMPYGCRPEVAATAS